MTGPTSVPARQQQAKRSARKYDYLTDKQEAATNTVLQQALLSDDWVEAPT